MDVAAQSQFVLNEGLYYVENDAFVVTAYLTDKPKAGEDLWPIK